MTFTRLLLAASLTAPAAACDGFVVEPIVQTQEPSDSHLPPARVNLPATPRLDLLEARQTLDDGTLTVAGLLLQRETLRDADVRVTGIVQTIYRCELAQGPGEGSAAGSELAGTPSEQATSAVTRRAGCLLPHIYVVDNLRSDNRMLVTGYDAAHYEPQLEVGGRYVFEGRYTQRAPGFMSTEYGLLDTLRIVGERVVQPGEGTGAAVDAASP